MDHRKRHSLSRSRPQPRLANTPQPRAGDGGGEGQNQPRSRAPAQNKPTDMRQSAPNCANARHPDKNGKTTPPPRATFSPHHAPLAPAHLTPSDFSSPPPATAESNPHADLSHQQRQQAGHPDEEQ